MLPPTLSPAIAMRLVSAPNSSGCGHILEHGIAFLNRDRIAVLGRAIIVDEHHDGVRSDGQLADQPVMRLAVA